MRVASACASPHQKRRVHLVVLVIEAKRVHREVHAEPDRELALVIAAGLHGVFPVAEVVARPRAAEIVARRVAAIVTGLAREILRV